MAFSKDDIFFGSCGRDGHLNIFKTDTGEKVLNFMRDTKIMSFAFSPTANQLVLGCKNQKLELIHFETNETLSMKMSADSVW